MSVNERASCYYSLAKRFTSDDKKRGTNLLENNPRLLSPGTENEGNESYTMVVGILANNRRFRKTDQLRYTRRSETAEKNRKLRGRDKKKDFVVVVSSRGVASGIS